MFCERCDLLTRRLAYESADRPGAELFSGSCMWADEVCREWCHRCMEETRLLFHARYCMTVGEPVSPEARSLWDQAEKEFPSWPIFLPERRSPEIAVEIRRLVEEMNEREFGPIEAMMRAEEGEPPDPALPRTPAPATGFRRFLRFFRGT